MRIAAAFITLLVVGCSTSRTTSTDGAVPDLAMAPASASDMAMTANVAGDLASPVSGAADLAGATWTLEYAHGLLVDGIFVASATDVWAIGVESGGVSGGILHSTGNGQWAQLQATSSAPEAIWAASAHDIWVGGGAGLLLHTVDGIGWTPSNYWSSHNTIEIDAIWGTSSTDLYVSTIVTADGTTGLYHTTGGDNWTAVALPAMTKGPLALWGSSATDLYAVDNNAILHGAGNGVWTSQAAGVGASAVWGSSAQDVYVVASAGANAGSAILHSTGDGHWTQQFSLTEYNTLDRIWGTSATDLWAVGSAQFGPDWYPIVEHCSGDGKWTNVSVTQAAGYLRAIGGANGEVFIGGNGGILHLH